MIDPIPPRRRLSLAHWLVIGLALLAFGLSAVLSRSVFERLPHLEDEIAYLFQARTLAGGQLVIETPQPRLAYWQPFIVDYEGHRFGKYSLGWPAQLALGVLLGEVWIVNACFAALTVALVYRLARALFNIETGLVAAALVAFSPAAVLLNATLMGHTTALFWSVAFVYAYWRTERGRHMVRWGSAAGLALGLVLINRPATGAALAVPFAAYSLVRLIRLAWPALQRRAPAQPLRRLTVAFTALALVTLTIGLVIPLYNAAATGDPARNLYRFVWDYDRIGFGEGYGRNGHTLEKGVRHMRFDLSLSAADLFGWQLPPLEGSDGAVRPELVDHFINEGDYYPAYGLSWVLLPLGLLVIYKWRSAYVFLWLALGLAWLTFPFIGGGGLSRDPVWAWVTVIGLLVWLCAPLAVFRNTHETWGWLLLAVILALIIFQLTYWIGSQRYSTRYYFEGLFAAAILSALPIVWLAQRTRRAIVYGVFALVLTASMVLYTLPRVGVLYQFNLIDRQLIDQVEARREGDRDLLVIVTGENVRWRSYGELMALTSPSLNSPIVAARASSSIPRDDILARFPGRQVIELEAEDNEVWFAGEARP
jgi:hypothetical protein